MDIPLDVIEDEQGRLRDIHDRPMVLIFSIRVTHKKFEFINVVKPGDVSKESRHLIKTHVMQNVRHRQRENSKATSSAPPGGQLCSRNHVSYSPSTIPPQITTDGPAFVGFPILMQPYMRKLLHQYSTSIMHITDPKHPANPTESAWFPMFMNDAALFHAVLCTSAIWTRLLSGGHDEVPQGKHMLEAISLINVRLRHVNVSDATLTTILFLAKAEYTQKNYTIWDVHMNGTRRIVEIRGGIMTLPALIRQKIYDAELLGCIETGSIPRFPFINLPDIEISKESHLLSSSFARLADERMLHGELLDIFVEIERIISGFTGAKSNPGLLESAMFQIRFRLLCLKGEDNSDDGSSVLNECLRLGALLYTQSLIRKPPVRGVDISVMLSRCQDVIVRLEISGLAPDGLLIWLSVIGGISSDGVHREWFAEKLRGLTIEINIWDQVRFIVGQYWWVDHIHELAGRQLWIEVRESSDI
ncbi:hypothetical protein IFR05_008186 [Cadophora sp. M221]|nr:hypothetical protein IFR05_008186 [Cadophora sp. M221]